MPALTSLLGFVFAGMLLSRFAARRRPYLFVWSLGLLWYALAAGAEALGGALGWTPALYRTWYVTGAIGVAAYLGAGAVYLHHEPAFRALTIVCVLLASAPALAGGHLAIGLLGLAVATALTGVLTVRPTWLPHALLAVLLLASAVAAYRVSTAPIDLALLPASADEVVSGQAFDAATRALSPPLNISGASLLLFGALSSVLRFGRHGAVPTRVASNVLIAVGALIPSLASGLTRFGVTSVFFVGELLGLACILAGFLLSGSTSAPSASPWSARPRRSWPPPGC